MSPNTATQVKDTIREYVTDLAEEGSITVNDDEDLMKLLDSLQILRLVSEVADHFSIEIDNGDLTPENFGSVERIAEFVTRKQC